MAMSAVTVLNGNSASTSMAAWQDASSVNYPVFSLDSAIPHYRASATFTPFVTAALTIIKLTGSATKTVHVSRILVGGTATGMAAPIFKLIRVSAIGAGGTAVSPTVAKLDTGAAAATAVATHYTTAANAADTTSEGSLSHAIVGMSITAVPTTNWSEQLVLFPERGGSALGGQTIVLRGTSEILAVTNVSPANMAAGTAVTYAIEWSEHTNG